MTSVYLGGLPDTVGHQRLLDHLSIYGRVTSLKVQKAYSFVEYASEADAKDLVAAFTNQPFLGHDVRVELAKKPRRQSTSSLGTPSPEAARTRSRAPSEGGRVRYPVVVENLNPATCWQELKDFGRLAGGDVAFCEVDKKNRWRGFIEFYDEHDAEQFVAQGNGKELLGNTVELFAQGRQVLRPEHGPASEPRCSPRQRERGHSSVSVSSRSYRQGSHSRSRSCSPLSSRRHGYNSSCDSMRPMYRRTHPRHDEHQPQANVDRHVSHHEQCPPRSPRDAHLNGLNENHAAARILEYKLSTTACSASGDYMDVYDDRHAQLERMWQEYGHMSVVTPNYH